MLVVGFPAGAFQANCYVIAADGGRECVVIDPGDGAGAQVEDTVREHGLTPAAVLATHGHLDHVTDAAAVGDAHGVPTWIRPEDRHLLADPLAGLGPELAAAFAGAVRVREPGQVAELGDEPLELAGMRIDVQHTPGHTQGSVVFGLASEEGGRLAFTGDTLFAGSIGRTDLPGGDTRRIARSLREMLLALDDETVVLPGHGPTTTVGRERAGNPFLSAEARRIRT